MTLKYLQYGFVILAILLGAYFAGVHTLIAKAASLVFKTDCVTAVATSTLSYMTPGTATTTITCGMGNDGANTAVLAIQVNATSTNTVYQIYVEESMDGQDYYPLAVNQSASTTNPFMLTTRAYATFTFASSTIGSGQQGISGNRIGVNGTNNRNHYELEVPVRMKWVRAYAALGTPLWDGNATSTAGAIWMQIIPKISI